MLFDLIAPPPPPPPPPPPTTSLFHSVVDRWLLKTCSINGGCVLCIIIVILLPICVNMYNVSIIKDYICGFIL